MKGVGISLFFIRINIEEMIMFLLRNKLISIFFLLDVTLSVEG